MHKMIFVKESEKFKCKLKVENQIQGEMKNLLCKFKREKTK